MAARSSEEGDDDTARAEEGDDDAREPRPPEPRPCAPAEATYSTRFHTQARRRLRGHGEAGADFAMIGHLHEQRKQLLATIEQSESELGSVVLQLSSLESGGGLF